MLTVAFYIKERTEKMKEKAKAVANIIIAGVLLLNAILTAAGKNPLPVDEDAIFEVASYVAIGIDTIWIWWKNQNLTVEAQTAQVMIDDMKGNKDEPSGVGDPEGDDAE